MAPEVLRRCGHLQLLGAATQQKVGGFITDCGGCLVESYLRYITIMSSPSWNEGWGTVTGSIIFTSISGLRFILFSFFGLEVGFLVESVTRNDFISCGRSKV